jgi:hypothetical protein
MKNCVQLSLMNVLYVLSKAKDIKFYRHQSMKDTKLIALYFSGGPTISFTMFHATDGYESLFCLAQLESDENWLWPHRVGNRGDNVSFALLNLNKTSISYDPTGLGIEEPKSLLLGSFGIRRHNKLWLRRLGNRGTLRPFPWTLAKRWLKSRLSEKPAFTGVPEQWLKR